MAYPDILTVFPVRKRPCMGLSGVTFSSSPGWQPGFIHHAGSRFAPSMSDLDLKKPAGCSFPSLQMWSFGDVFGIFYFPSLSLVFPAGFLVSGGTVWDAFISISRGMSNLDVLILKAYNGPTRTLMRVPCLKYTTHSEGIFDNHTLLGHSLYSLTCPFIDLHHLFLSFHFAGPQ